MRFETKNRCHERKGVETRAFRYPQRQSLVNGKQAFAVPTLVSHKVYTVIKAGGSEASKGRQYYADARASERHNENLKSVLQLHSGIFGLDCLLSIQTSREEAMETGAEMLIHRNGDNTDAERPRN